MNAYGITWLDRFFRPFTTNASAIGRFQIQSQFNLPSYLTNWTFETTEYGTSFGRRQATRSGHGQSVSYSTGDGCTTEPGVASLDSSSPYAGLYIGWYMNRHIDFTLSKIGCTSPQFPHTFLAFWVETGFKNRKTLRHCSVGQHTGLGWST